MKTQNALFLSITLLWLTGCSGIVSTAPILNPFALHFGATSLPAGAGGDDWVNAMTSDSLGNLYVAGATKSPLGGRAAQGWDAFVMKILPNGSREWTTQIDSGTAGVNAAGDDTPRGIVIVGDALYISGYTTGALGEVSGGGADVFLSKLTLAGVHVWTKQLGSVTRGAASAGTDQAWAMVTDGTSLYLSGHTTGALGETNAGLADAFLAKFNTSGELIWLKQIGGPTVTASPEINAADLNEYSVGIDVDVAGSIYVAVYSRSAFKEVNRGLEDAAVVKFLSDGSISWVTHLGATTLAAGKGLGGDFTDALKVNKITGDIYLSGVTGGIMGTASGGGADCFVARLTSAGSLTSIWQLSTNATAAESDCSMSLDTSGNVFVTATTKSSLFDTLSGFTDAFVLKLDANLNLQWSRQFGASERIVNSAGTFGDYTYVIHNDVNGNVIIGGGTYGSFLEPANNLNAFADLLLLRITTNGVTSVD